MTLGHLIRKNTLWLLGGNVTGQGINFVVGIVLARLLIPADFGMVVTIQVLVGMLGFVASGGMGEALVQAKEVSRDDFNTVFTLQFAICVSIYVVLYIIAPWFAVVFNDDLYTELLRVSALSFLMRPLQNFHRSKLRRDMRFKEIAIVGVTTLFSTSIISIAMAYNQMGVWSLILSGLFAGLVSMLMFKHFTKMSPLLFFDKKSAKILGTYGLKFAINDIILHLKNQTSNVIISRISGPTDVGLINKADSLNTQPLTAISGTTYQTVFRALSQEQDNSDKSKYIYYRTISLVTVYAMPFYIGLAWVAEPFILTLYGHKWIEAALPLRILALAGLFKCIANVSGALIAAQNRLSQEIRIQIESWVLLGTGCIIGIQWGIVGVAIGLLPSHIYIAIRMNRLANMCVKGSFLDLFRSLKPMLILNAGLLFVLTLTELAIPNELYTERPRIYLATMVLMGGVSYALLFLYLPIPELLTEAGRWKSAVARVFHKLAKDTR